MHIITIKNFMDIIITAIKNAYKLNLRDNKMTRILYILKYFIDF